MTKAMIVEAKVPESKEKGTKEMTGTVTVQTGETLEEMVQMFGAEAVKSNAESNWVVTLQSAVRAGLRRGETQEQIQARLGNAKMGVKVVGAKVDPYQAYIAMYASATPEAQKKMIAELQARATKK